MVNFESTPVSIFAIININITYIQSYEGDEYHLDGKTNDYFTSVVELVEFYRRNSLMKVKPTESEFQTITGRPSHARKGSFLGVQG